MATILIVLIVLGGLALRASTPEERARLLRAVLAAIRRAQDTEANSRRESEPFHDALRTRTRLALVTPTLVALNATIFVFMLFGAGALSDPATLVAWGGNFGPRTTNGEWWRLVTTMFVHAGMLHLLANVAGLVQLGLMLERLVGRLAFGAVYVAAGVFASLVHLSAHPLDVSVGAAGAIFGLYGFLLALLSWRRLHLIWGRLHRSTVTIPLAAIKRLGPAAAVFTLYNVATGSLESAAAIAGIVVGFVFGLVLVIGVGDRKPSARRVAATTAVTVVIAAASAVPMRGITDVRPEIERVVAVEDRTAGAYQTAVEGFNHGRMTAEALVQLIERTIMPELQAAEARLKHLDGVPQEQQPLVAGAEEYLRLRSESWRLRAEGLRKTNMRTGREGRTSDEWRLRAEVQHRANMIMLGRAEGTERASLEALQKIKPVDRK